MYIPLSKPRRAPRVFTFDVQLSIAQPFNVFPNLQTNINLAFEWFAINPKAYHIRFDGPMQYEMHQGAQLMKRNSSKYTQ